MFLHNLRVLNSNLSDNILYLVTFTFKLAKHKMAAEIQRYPRIFYVFFVQESTIDDFCKIFIIYFFSSVFGKNETLFDL